MAQVDLTVYRYALFLRSLIYKKLRHDENPDDSRFPWDAGDEKTIAELMVFLHLEVSSEFGSPLFYSQALQAIQTLINNYNQVDISNLPPPDVIAAYERYLQEKEKQTAVVGSTRLKKSKDSLRRRVNITLPQIDPQTLEYLVTTILANAASEDPGESVPQSIQIVNEAATIAGQVVSSEELVATISAAAPVWESTSTDFTAVKRIIDEQVTADPFTSDYITTAIFSPSTPIIPSPQFEAAAITATQSPAAANTATRTLTDRQVQLANLVTKIRRAQAESKQIEADIHKQLSLNPSLKGSDLTQTSAVIRYSVLPTVLFGHSLATRAGATPEQIKAIDKFLTHIGYHQGLKELGITNVSASARMAAQKAASHLDFSQLFNSTVDTQIFYSAKATSSPQMRAFLQDLQTLETIDFSSVAGLADRHFDLKSLDASLDKYFTDKTTLNLARAQNWAGDILAKFVPEAKPIVAVIKPLNKLLFLILDKTIAKPLKTIGYAILAVSGLAVVENFSLGIGLFFLGWLAGRIASGVGRVVSAAGTAVVATFTSFMTVSFIVFLSIPIAVALILFIINNSAYIVPQAGGVIGLGGVSSSVSCFTFENFAADELQAINAAAQTIAAQGCYNNRLCSGGPIRVVKIDQNRCYGGYADSGNRIIYIYNTGVRQIIRSAGSCSSGQISPFNSLYTLAHESGHVFARFDSEYNTTYAGLGLPFSDGQCLPTYHLYNNDDPVRCEIDGPNGPVVAAGEDKAEIIADFFSYPEMLQNFSVHSRLAEQIFNSCSTKR